MKWIANEIIGDLNVKVGSQEKPGVTVKFGLEYGMKQGKGYAEYIMRKTGLEEA